MDHPWKPWKAVAAVVGMLLAYFVEGQFLALGPNESLLFMAVSSALLTYAVPNPKRESQ